MATITAVITNIDTANDLGYEVFWETLTSADTVGSAVQLWGAADRSVHVVGTFGSATVVLQGSNDNSNWVTLTDPLGAAISFTTTGLKQVSEITRYIRPSTSGGDGTQDVDVYVLARRGSR